MTDGKNIGETSPIQKYICQYVTFMTWKIKSSILNYSGTSGEVALCLTHVEHTHLSRSRFEVEKVRLHTNPKQPLCKPKPDSRKQAQSSGDATLACRVVSWWRHPHFTRSVWWCCWTWLSCCQRRCSRADLSSSHQQLQLHRLTHTSHNDLVQSTSWLRPVFLYS